MFAATTVYSVIAVYVFDAFWKRPDRPAEDGPAAESA